MAVSIRRVRVGSGGAVDMSPRVGLLRGVLVISMLTVLAEPSAGARPYKYPWLEQYDASQSVAARIPPPQGFHRVDVIPGTFAGWLRHLPLKASGSPVRLHDGKLKANQSVHHAVVDIDVGTEDLQQCADAVMRLRAEYLYSLGKYNAIHFDFTSGDRAAFRDWVEGLRPRVSGDIVEWHREAEPDSGHTSFRRYLDSVFMYAGSYSLARETEGVDAPGRMEIGDVFVDGGFPGHAVMVVDMAVDGESGERVFLLAQSYMPAQDIHILRNLEEPKISPWYRLDFGNVLATPEWVFRRTHLARWPWSDPWIRVEDGLDIAEVVSPVPSDVGDSKMALVRIDPTRFEFKLMCASELGSGPMTLKAWCERYGLLAAVNAGMFQADRLTHVAYMRNGDHINNGYLRGDYNAFFAFGRKDSTVPEAQIIDRKYQDFDLLAPKYAVLIQNMRMISSAQENVWSHQGRRWSTAALASDTKGNIIFILMRSPYAVHDLNAVLLSLPISIHNAMYLEGGPEASLYLASSGFEFQRMGSYETGFWESDANRTLWPVPNAIGIVRK
jgi:hypothetical protein